MSAYHVRLDALDVESRCTTPPDSRQRAGRAKESVLHPEDSDSERREELLIVRAAIRRLSEPVSEREKVHREIVRRVTKDYAA